METILEVILSRISFFLVRTFWDALVRAFTPANVTVVEKKKMVGPNRDSNSGHPDTPDPHFHAEDLRPNGVYYRYTIGAELLKNEPCCFFFIYYIHSI